MVGMWQKSKKLQVKWNFELTVFELTMPDLKLRNEMPSNAKLRKLLI